MRNEIPRKLGMTVRFPPPLDIDASLALFRRSGDDLIDRWDGVHLVRTAPVGGQTVAYCCTLAGGVDAPAFSQIVPPSVRRLVAETFFLAPPAWADLLARDPVLAALDQRFPGVRQPRQYDLFGALVRCISAQQVNLRWAVTTRRRLAEHFGERHCVEGHAVYRLDPHRLASVPPPEIRALQFTTSKSEFIVAVARALADGLTLADLECLSDEQVIATLTAIRGIGRWSAEWILARTLGRPVVVAGDLGVRKAVGLAYLNDPLPSEHQVRRATTHWAESAGVAQALLLHALVENALPGPPHKSLAI